MIEVIKCEKQRGKVPISRRGEDFARDLDIILDLAICRHDSVENCVCPADHKVNDLILDK